MLDKVLTKLFCLVGGWLLQRKINQFLALKGVSGMKCTTTLKGLEVSFSGKESPHLYNNDGRIIGNAPPVEVVNCVMKIGESTTDLDLDKEEFSEVEKLAQEAAKDVRDNFLKPMGRALMPLIEKFAEAALQDIALGHAERAARLQDKEEPKKGGDEA